MQKNSVLEPSYINDFHRQSTLAAMKGVEKMLSHPYSREQKLAQINSLRQKAVSKERSNAERSKNRIESWAKAAHCWIDNTNAFYERTLGEQIAQGG